MNITTKTCQRCGATWIGEQLYWSGTHKPGKNEDLAGLVCNRANDPVCINPKKGDETGDTWEKRARFIDAFNDGLKVEFDRVAEAELN